MSVAKRGTSSVDWPWMLNMRPYVYKLAMQSIVSISTCKILNDDPRVKYMKVFGIYVNLGAEVLVVCLRAGS